MADSYHEILFLPKENNLVTVTIAYRIFKPEESSVFKQVFPFRIQTFQSTGKETVAEWLYAFENQILAVFATLLGKNVKIEYLQIENSNTKDTYRRNYSNTFGVSDAASNVTDSLIFELNPFNGKSALRHYVRAASIVYSKRPLSEEREDFIHSFELLFVQPIFLFDKKCILVFQHRTSQSTIVAANLKTTASFKKKAITQKPTKAKTSVRKKSNTRRAFAV